MWLITGAICFLIGLILGKIVSAWEESHCTCEHCDCDDYADDCPDEIWIDEEKE